MIDCLSNGRLISGFARGIPREYQVHNVPLDESRARFEEAYDIITRAWTEEVFSYEGQVLVLQGRGAVAAAGAAARTRRSGSRSSAARNRSSSPRKPRYLDHPRPGPRARAARRHHPLLREMPRRQPATASRRTICRSASPPMSPIQQGAGGARSTARIILYFNRTLFSHGNFTETEMQRRDRLFVARPRPIMCGRRICARRRACASGIPQPDHGAIGASRPSTCRWARPTRSPSASSPPPTAPAPTRCSSAINRGALPHDLFMAQIERFAREVLPALQAHEVKTVPAAEGVLA